jgi:CAAX prenyl protease-like protein
MNNFYNFKYYLPHTAPFLIFAILTFFFHYINTGVEFAYPLKTILATAVFFFFFKEIKKEISFKFDLTALISGVIVFLLWVGLEGFYPLVGADQSFDFTQIENRFYLYTYLFFRFSGSDLLVPVIEEVFWRSFALRFLIDSDFKKVSPGTFSWFSFIAVSLAFGFEHNRWLPGILSGMIFALVYYRTKNLFSPVLSHAVANFLIGIYVFYSGELAFW